MPEQLSFSVECSSPVAKLGKNAGCTVVLGGYHPTFAEEETLSTAVVDYVVSDVTGLSYLKNSSAVRTGPSEAPQDLDSQPLQGTGEDA